MFNSNTQKIARNKHGTIIGYVRRQNAASTSQEIVFTRIDPLGVKTEVLNETHATNPPCVESGADGEFFALFPDWSLSLLHVYVWRDISVNVTPERHVFPLYGSGKFSCSFDESRRLLYYISINGDLVSFNVDSGNFSKQQIWTHATNVAQYPYLQISGDGSLHVFWNTLTGNKISYRGIQYLVTPDGALNWYRNWHPAGSANFWLQSPINHMPVLSDESGMSFLLSREEDLLRNSFMLSGYADNDAIAAIWHSVPNQFERCFVKFERCTSVLVVYDRKTLARSYQAVPLLLGRIPVRPHGGAGLIKRGGKFYIVWNDHSDVIVARLEGSALVKVARESIPGASDSHCPYALTVERGHDSDTDIVGVFTLLMANCVDWATSSAPAGTFEGKLFRFRVQLDQGSTGP